MADRAKLLFIARMAIIGIRDIEPETLAEDARLVEDLGMTGETYYEMTEDLTDLLAEEGLGHDIRPDTSACATVGDVVNAIQMALPASVA
ncbi:MAG: hypothetical protein GC129_04935 [Proteobacteria bacterium]|nr:hypothetical protein [Pseudomonadota bacterium]